MLLNTEVTIMALNQERERQIAKHLAETRVRQALAERPAGTSRSDRLGALRRAAQGIETLLHSRWRPGVRRGGNVPCASAAD